MNKKLKILLPSLLYSLPSWGLLIATIWISQGFVTFSYALILLLIIFIKTFLGEKILSFFKYDNPCLNGILSFIVGCIFILPLMFFCTFFFPISAMIAFLIVCILLFLSFKNQKQILTAKKSEVIFSMFCSILVVLLVFLPIRSFYHLQENGHFGLWSDYYIHGTTINTFGSSYIVGLGDPSLVGTPNVFYHYAAFLLPSIISQISGTSGPLLSVALLLPLGILIAVLGMYALGCELKNKLGGALVLIFITLVPWPFNYTNASFYDHMWSLFSSPGASYSIGITCASIIFLKRYFDKNIKRILILSFISMISLILFRVQMFMLFAPVWFLTLIAYNFPNLRLHLLIGTVTLFLVPFTLPFMEMYTHSSRFLNSLTGYMEWSLLDSHFLKKITSFFVFSKGLYVFTLMGAIIFAVSGIFIIDIFFRLIAYAKRAPTLAIEWIPIFTVLSFVGLLLFAPAAAHADASEFKQRHFVLIYAILVVYSATSFSKWVPEILQTWLTDTQKKYIWLVVILLSIGSWSLQKNPASPKGEIAGWGLFNQKIFPYAQDIATYLRKEAQIGDVIAFDPIAAKDFLVGPAIEVASFSAIPVYLLRGDLQKTRNPEIAKVALERNNTLMQIMNQKEWGQMKELLKNKGIRWFISFGKNRPFFDRKTHSEHEKFPDVFIYDSKK